MTETGTREPPGHGESIAEPPHGSAQYLDLPVGTTTLMDAHDIPYYPPETVAIFRSYSRLHTAARPRSRGASAGEAMLDATANPQTIIEASARGWLVAATAASDAVFSATATFTTATRARALAHVQTSPSLDNRSHVYTHADNTAAARLFAPNIGVSSARTGGAGTLSTPAHATAQAGLGITATLTMTTSLFKASKMTKTSGFKSDKGDWTQIPDWTPQPGSTLVGHGLVVNGGKSNATLEARIPWSGQTSLGAEVRIRIKVNNTTIAVTGEPVTSASPVCTASTVRTLNHGDVITVEIYSNSAPIFQPSIAAGPDTWVSVT